MTVTIENFREQPPGTSVFAIFDVYMPAAQCRYRQLRLIRSKQGKTFITFPAFGIAGDDGKKVYTPYIEYSKERQGEFFRLVEEALKPYIKT